MRRYKQKKNTYLNDLITRKVELRDICSIASHQVAVQNTKDTFVCNDQKIILLTLKLENYGLQSNSKIVVRLISG